MYVDLNVWALIPGEDLSDWKLDQSGVSSMSIWPPCSCSLRVLASATTFQVTLSRCGLLPQ
jgi:hypothetical protein